MKTNMLARITALPQMPMGELAAMWEELFKSQAPKYNKPYLVKRLAYRLQEIAYNVDSDTIEKRLERYAKESLSENLRKPRGEGRHLPVVGTKLVRIHHWHRTSGDSPCRRISNTRARGIKAFLKSRARSQARTWSGPVFFGLVSYQRKKA